MGIIYVATNILNGKSYVGKTIKTLAKRKTEHISNPSTLGFHGAIKKYGSENFDWKILVEAPEEKLSSLEIKFIKEMKTYVGFDDCNGYNRTLGGDGASSHGNPWSRPEIIQKLANKRRGIPLLDSVKKKISKSLLGKPRSKESIQKGIVTVATNKALGRYKKKTGSNSPLAKRWIITFPSGKEEEICGLREFCRQHKLNAKLLREVAKGKWKHHKHHKLRELSTVKDTNLMSTSDEDLIVSGVTLSRLVKMELEQRSSISTESGS